MSFLIFIAALLAIVGLAAIVNRITGTTSSYLDALKFEHGEQELWRDASADFALVTRLGRAVVISFIRNRRHIVVWTNRRIIVAQKALFSVRRVITHQVYFDNNTGAGGAEANKVSREFSGGFYGRGFQTIVAETRSFGQRDNKDCVRITPTQACGAAQNIDEILIFTDQLADLERRLRMGN